MCVFFFKVISLGLCIWFIGLLFFIVVLEFCFEDGFDSFLFMFLNIFSNIKFSLLEISLDFWNELNYLELRLLIKMGN